MIRFQGGIDVAEEWHAKGTEEVFQALNTTTRGLSSKEAERRLEGYGLNELKEAKRVTALDIFLDQFKDIFMIMLIVATAIAYYIASARGEAPTDAITISAIIVLNTVVGFIQEYRSEKAMDAMKKLIAPKARVIRDGKEISALAKEVVPGDIFLLESGDRVTADARLIEVLDLKTDEAVLTGESTPVDKSTDPVGEKAPVSDRKNMIFMATNVIHGRGKAIVTSTGMKTEFGKIAEMVQAVKEERTPLEQKLGKFAKKIGMIVAILCAVVFLLELLNPARPGTVMESFLTAIALAVSAVPEGLPAVVTVTLALGAQELAKRNAIVRRLSSVETLGATTVICSDKTGTLTKGEMTVRKVCVNSENVEVTGVGYEAEGDFILRNNNINAKEDKNLSLLLMGAALCNNASYDGKNMIGDTTEGALVIAATKAGIIKAEMEKQHPRIHEIPFTPERKRMTTVHRSSEGKLIVFMKGAPEIVSSRCINILRDGKTKKLNEKERKTIRRANEDMANEALRVLGIAFKELADKEIQDFSEKGIDEDIENRLVFIGLAGMIDPPRGEAKEANRLCQQASIRTIMITGDHKLTAMAVAKEIGMMKSGVALTGEELDKVSDEEFDKIVESVAVYARVSPEHKLRIVKALKKKGHIVAMTGDGVNDAPALKQSDIGVAMGITGTDVTKEAADIVLADDNFATIVKAVEGGRTIYDNIRNFSFFLLRCNFDELLVVGTFALMGLKLPFTAGMILWINLMTDGAPAIALSQDPSSDDVMKRPPRRPEEGLLYGRLASILVTLITQFIGTVVVFCVAYYVWHEPLEEARTLAFMQATMQELIIVWNCRSESKNAFRVGFTNNKYLLLAVVFSGAITLLIPLTGALFGFSVFETAPMTLMDWAIVIPFSLSGFLVLPEVFYKRKILRWR